MAASWTWTPANDLIVRAVLIFSLVLAGCIASAAVAGLRVRHGHVARNLKWFLSCSLASTAVAMTADWVAKPPIAAMLSLLALLGLWYLYKPPFFSTSPGETKPTDECKPNMQGDDARVSFLGALESSAMAKHLTLESSAVARHLAEISDTLKSLLPLIERQGTEDIEKAGAQLSPDVRTPMFENLIMPRPENIHQIVRTVWRRQPYGGDQMVVVRTMQTIYAGLFYQLEEMSDHKRDKFFATVSRFRVLMFDCGLEEWGYEYLDQPVTALLNDNFPANRLDWAAHATNRVPETAKVIGVELPGFRWSLQDLRGRERLVASHPRLLIA
jgi:hypothetical protein